MTQTANGRGAPSTRTTPRAGAGRTSSRARGTSPARTGGRPRTTPARTERQWLGQWNSTVTSYYLLVGATALLTIVGLVMVFSSSAVTQIAAGKSPFGAFLDQAKFALMGLPVLLVATRIPVDWYKRLAWPALVAALGLQMLVFTPLAKSVNGNAGWIDLGVFTFQPAEVAKLGLALWLGAVLGRKQRLLGQWKHVVVPAVPVAVLVIGLVLAGHDLGTALVVMALVAGAFFVSGADGRLLALGAAVAAFVVAYVFILNQDGGDRLGRILATYRECTDTLGECYQSRHGLWALGTGGFTGVGLGASREKWSYLPEAHNDFIFAVIGEELGLLGTLLVLGLFVIVGVATSRIVRRHPDPFVKITTAAIACWIVGQAFINIGVVIGLLPVIGVPLPLVSAGGSALIMTMAALGVLISFARTEPGAAEALAARGSVVRRSLAVVGRAAPRRRTR
ncbi:cell division protein FtsW [Cellulosimicrobium cellulans J34]|nr:putative lipid II flippase FtsW [Cellulosimicrobium sp. MM]KFD43684.1 cell division protein FtsW [Cellulosimicrobium sp. MM]TWG82322.1 cell division protein FtsW [Cellulosimicrobium cellulans J34]SMF33876.1 cell division-specific peptidoglycan biosynthesis regulator FtsW [Cellulosimicrobium cellulans J1]